MKKVVYVILTVGILFVGMLSNANEGNAYRDDEEIYGYNPYVYANSATVREHLAVWGEELFDSKEKSLYELTGLLPKEKIKKIQRFDIEARPFSLEGLQYLSEVKLVELEGYAVDPRPLEELASITDLRLYHPFVSLDFIRKLKTLESLSIVFTSELNDDEAVDRSLQPIHDLSPLNSLDNLKEAEIDSQDRYLPTLVLKKSMKQYQLVNPIILSKQFDNAEIIITSKDSGFSYKNDVLNWENLSEEDELHFSCKVKNGHFTYSATTIIPIVWK